MGNITINSEPHKGKVIEIHDYAVHIFVGKNGTGKSRLLKSLKEMWRADAVHLTRNFEGVPSIQAASIEGIIKTQANDPAPHQVSSVIAADLNLKHIMQYYFQLLLNTELTQQGNDFKSGDFGLPNDADGFKSIFNLIYYIISPHKIILMDEPERFLHPSLRSFFISILSVIAKKYKKNIFIATHSPSLIRFDLDNVYTYQLSRSPNKIIDLKQWLENLPANTPPEQQYKKSFQDWFYYHSDIVFSNKVVLLEGISDQIVMEALKQKLCYELKVEDLCFKSVACAIHEPGGKSRLYKIQNVLKNLVPTFCIADKDIINQGITNWFTPSAGDNDTQKIKKAKTKGLYILSSGEIEDYYFIESGSHYCSSITNAKNEKIAAAYEQAQIIASKDLSDVKGQYNEIFSMLNEIAPQPVDLKKYLFTAAQNYVMEMYGRGFTGSDHFNAMESGDEVEITFNFIDLKKEIKINTKLYKKAIAGIEKDINDSL
ncbi:MAG: AAA family ATPase [Candidatus Aminicenantes bacterium]|nr:AAA family ATPase [Candidatus Aminicenantes bacterium]